MPKKPEIDSYNDKDHDLLIRIDEQIKLLLQRLLKVEESLTNNNKLFEDLQIRTTKLEKDLYGDKFIDGIVTKVEKHDKIIIKSIAVFGFIIAVFDYAFKWLVLK